MFLILGLSLVSILIMFSSLLWPLEIGESNVPHPSTTIFCAFLCINLTLRVLLCRLYFLFTLVSANYFNIVSIFRIPQMLCEMKWYKQIRQKINSRIIKWNQKGFLSPLPQHPPKQLFRKIRCGFCCKKMS
jgi:hypothetical protein